MHTTKHLDATRRIGTGLSFVIFPMVFVFAFSVHPDLLHPRLFGPSELILRARGDGLLQFAHAMVTVNTALLIATPDGVEIVNLTASVLLTIVFVPYGVQIVRNESQEFVAS